MRIAMDWQRLVPGWLQRRLAAARPQASVDQPERLLGAVELARPALLLAALVLLVICSAMGVIYSAYQYRVLFNQHQNLISDWDELQVEWGQLVLEESAWAANNRIEQVASKRLEMQVPEPGMIEIVRHER
ncbi:MAG: cell division protein FtsL [Oceanospirillaceae bacterium]|nr:cell division protein FtsL [Oceanospirillaceae bacterium]